jgi:dTDP-4-amino-4,6-dideoxygalactose transaminase
MDIPLNKPCLAGNELRYINQAVKNGHISGNGPFTKKCQKFFEEKYGFRKCLLTTSCTDALEMAAILLDIKEGDEVIMPSFTFVSSANAFVLRGAKIIFADSRKDHPGIDEDHIEDLITKRTKAIVPVHYAGVACDMAKIMQIAERNKLFVVEDAAQAVDSYYKGTPLGSIGHLATFSFHETKNISSGEGGMLVINDEKFVKRAEIIWEKGTNRVDFFRGKINKYGWVDIGSSFLPSDINAAYLYAQLENIELIQHKRSEIWKSYYEKLASLTKNFRIRLPFIPDYALNNYHLFYVIAETKQQRDELISFLRKKGICSVIHYLPLHLSPYYHLQYFGNELVNSVYYSDHLLRLPFFIGLSEEEIEFITDSVIKYFN